MATQGGKDAGGLSLQPSKAAGGRPGFSNVQGRADTIPASGHAGTPDFSNVQGYADTVPADGGGPTNAILAAAQASANSAFSERKP